MKIDEIKKECIIFSAISGSHAYGLNTPDSDIDHRGVFIAPKELYYGLNIPDQVSDEKNDTIFYELKRFIELIGKQNPNIIEFLGFLDQFIEIKHPLFDKILKYKDKFITRKIRDTFGGYAIAQIGKARGLNKKIVQPMDKEKLTPSHFCFVPLPDGSVIPLTEWLSYRSMDASRCGLSSLPHIRDGYALFYDYYTNEANESAFRGICFDDSNDVHLSSIPKGFTMQTTIFYNKDGYSKYCRDYKDYWDWVEKRNPARYAKNMEIGKGSDFKNMMHCVRLLRMAEEMLRTGKLNVYRKDDREELLDIRNGLREYDDLVNYAEGKIKLLDELLITSPLPKDVDMELLNNLLIEIRDEYYAGNWS